MGRHAIVFCHPLVMTQRRNLAFNDKEIKFYIHFRWRRRWMSQFGILASAPQWFHLVFTSSSFRGVESFVTGGKVEWFSSLQWQRRSGLGLVLNDRAIKGLYSHWQRLPRIVHPPAAKRDNKLILVIPFLDLRSDSIHGITAAAEAQGVVRLRWRQCLILSLLLPIIIPRVTRKTYCSSFI